MQVVFGDNPALIEQFKNSISAHRYHRYITLARGNDVLAIELYQWNARLSQALYVYIQGWEVCLRNKLNGFLVWKYNSNWPYDEFRAFRNFTGSDRAKLTDAKERQEKERKTSPAPLPGIVADLSAGFWVSQLSGAYDIPYKWRYNLQRIFPNDRSLNSRSAWTICDELLSLRNRIAHHEAILHLPLEQRHRDLQRIVAAMCPATHAFCEASCIFRDVWKCRPPFSN